MRLLVRSIRLRGADKVAYGPFNEDDYLVWKTPLGYEGIALAPLRKIRVEKQTGQDKRNAE